MGLRSWKNQVFEWSWWTGYKLFLSLALAFTLVVVITLTPPVWKLKEGPVKVLRWQKKQGATEVLVGPNQPSWVSYDRISKHAINAIIAAEDGAFFDHYGFDLTQILRSLELNWRLGRYARGASTITQQVIKLSLLSRDKTLTRKLSELLGALWLEWELTKEDILAWYLNLVDFGSGTSGLTEAAQHYFRTRPELLTLEESVHLALVIPSPNRWSQGLKQKKLTEFGHRRFYSILTTVFQSGLITEALYLTALKTGDFGRPIQSTQLSKEAFPEAFDSDIFSAKDIYEP